MLRPIEQQTLLNRGTETSRLQGARDSQNLLGGQGFHTQFRQEVSRRPQQVNSSLFTDENRVGAEGHGPGQEQTGGNRRQRREEPAQPAPHEPGKGVRLDIRA